jgi:hypothetical protein
MRLASSSRLTVTIALVASAASSVACGAVAPSGADSNDSELGSAVAPLHGQLTEGESTGDEACSYTSSEWNQIRRAVLYARAVVASPQFATCVTNAVSSGAILGCPGLDVVAPSTPNYARVLIDTIDSANDVTLKCDHLGGLYGLGGNPQSTNGEAEEVFVNPDRFNEGLAELADTIVHEIYHSKNYWHGDGCDQPDDGKTVPWGVATCVSDLLTAAQAAGDIEVCGNGGIGLLAGNDLECQFAPYGPGAHTIPADIATVTGGDAVTWSGIGSSFTTTTSGVSRSFGPYTEGTALQLTASYSGSEPLQVTGNAFTVPAAGYLITSKQAVTVYRPSIIMASL